MSRSRVCDDGAGRRRVPRSIRLGISLLAAFGALSTALPMVGADDFPTNPYSANFSVVHSAFDCDTGVAEETVEARYHPVDDVASVEITEAWFYPGPGLDPVELEFVSTMLTSEEPTVSQRVTFPVDGDPAYGMYFRFLGHDGTVLDEYGMSMITEWNMLGYRCGLTPPSPPAPPVTPSSTTTTTVPGPTTVPARVMPIAEAAPPAVAVPSEARYTG